MVERTLILAHGLHARPAALLVQAAQQFADTHIVVRKGGREASARSLIGLLSLGVAAGEALVVRCDGPREQEALAAVVALMEGVSGAQ